MKTVAQGAAIPLGLSRWKDVLDEGWQLRFPIFIWHGRHYDIKVDAWRPGWSAFFVLLKRKRQELSLRWGWGFIKQTGPLADLRKDQ